MRTRRVLAMNPVVPEELLLDTDVDAGDPAARVRYWQGAFADTPLRARVYEELARTPFAQYQGRFMGKPYLVPRTIAAFSTPPGLPFTYSGYSVASAAMPPAFDALRQHVERATGASYNYLLVNRYVGGANKVGWHADDEASIVSLTTIASVTFVPDNARARKFQWRRVRATRARKLPGAGGPIASRVLYDGDLLTMEGSMQVYYHHAVPAVGAKSYPADAVRYNFTFRRMHVPAGFAPAAPGSSREEDDDNAVMKD